MLSKSRRSLLLLLQIFCTSTRATKTLSHARTEKHEYTCTPLKASARTVRRRTHLLAELVHFEVYSKISTPANSSTLKKTKEVEIPRSASLSAQKGVRVESQLPRPAPRPVKPHLADQRGLTFRGALLDCLRNVLAAWRPDISCTAVPDVPVTSLAADITPMPC